MRMSITERQQQILEYMKSYQIREGFPPTVREICKALGLVSPGSLIKHLQALEREGRLAKVLGKKRAWKLIDRSSPFFIPLIGRIAAGTPILAEQNREDYLPVDPHLFGSHEAFALRVKGDSMIDAQIREGDLAIIRPQSDAESGEIVAAQVEGVEPEATLKILRRRNGDIELQPANPAYKTQLFRGEARAKVKILGKLIGVIRPKP
jgi:repressor LexA